MCPGKTGRSSRKARHDIVLVNFVGFQFTRGDQAKDAIFHAGILMERDMMIKEKFRKNLSSKIEEIESLAALQSCSPQFNSWRKSTEDLILQMFGDGEELDSFNSIFYSPVFLSCCMDDSAFTEAFQQGLGEARRVLESLRKKYQSLHFS